MFGWLGNLFGRGSSVATTPSVLGNPSAQGLAPTRYPAQLEELRADIINWPMKGPGELDNYGAETPEMREAYLRMSKNEAVVRSALLIKVAEVATRHVVVNPDDDKDQQSKQIAEFVDWTVRKGVGDNAGIGWPALITKILRPGLIMGWSATEKVLDVVENSHKWKNLWGLKNAKSKDTQFLKLQLDVYRNVIGIVNLVRGLESYSPERVILFTHLDLFDNPFGESDLRACYRAVKLYDDALRLWYFALQMFGEPMFKGRASSQNRIMLETALKAARGSREIVLTGPAETDNVELLNLASSVGFDSFERKLRFLREECLLAINGAYTPFIQSNAGAGETRGDSAENRDAASDPLIELLQTGIERVINQQLIPSLVIPNWGRNVGFPTVKLGGTDWQKTNTLLDVAAKKKGLGGSVSKRWLAETTQVPDAEDPGDELPGEQPQGGGPPGAGGMLPPSGNVSGGSPGQPRQLPPHGGATGQEHIAAPPAEPKQPEPPDTTTKKNSAAFAAGGDLDFEAAVVQLLAELGAPDPKAQPRPAAGKPTPSPTT